MTINKKQETKFLIRKFQFCFHELSPLELYNGHSTIGRQPPIFNKHFSTLLCYFIKLLKPITNNTALLYNTLHNKTALLYNTLHNKNIYIYIYIF